MNTLIENTQFIEPEIIEQGITNGAYQSGWRFRVEFHSSDWDAYDQLKTFKDEHTLVRSVAVGAGVGSKNLQWYESVQIAELRKVPKPNRADGDSHFVVTLIHEGGENAAIFNNVNLLHQANVNGVTVTGFLDSDADNLADGYSIFGGSADLFTSGAQLISATASSYLRRTIIFPIALPIFTLSSNFTKKHSNSLNFIGFRSLDFGGSELTLTNRQVGDSGFQSSTITITNSNYYQCEVHPFRVLSPGSSDTFGGKEPCLRTDGVAEFIAG